MLHGIWIKESPKTHTERILQMNNLSKKQITALYVLVGIVLVCLIGAIIVVVTGGDKSSESKSVKNSATVSEDDTSDTAKDDLDANVKSNDEIKDGEDAPEAGDVVGSADIDSLMSELVPMMGLAKTVDLDASKVAYYYELEESDFAAAKGVIGDVALADELVIIEAKDAAGVDKIKAGAEGRLNSQKNSFQDYIPEQFKRLDGAKIVTAGNYVMYVVSDNADKIVDAFNEKIN